MADVKISALPAAGSALTTDQHPVNQGGTTKRVTLAQMLAASFPLSAPNGLVSAPSYRFDSDTGIYSTGDGNWSVATNGVNALSIENNQNATFAGSVTANGGFIFPTQADNAFFAGPVSGGPTAPTFRAIAAGDIPASAIPYPLDLPLGLVSAPSIRFDSDTGIYSTGDGNLSVAANLVQVATFEPSVVSVLVDLAVTGNISAANYPPAAPSGPNNTLTYYNGSGALDDIPNWNVDPTTFALGSNLTVQPNNGGGNTLHSHTLTLDPLQNSPNENWLMVNYAVNLDPNSTGFGIGNTGNAATIINGGFQHQGTSNVGGLTYLNFNSNFGNGTDAITIKSVVGGFVGSNFAANTTIDGQVLSFAANHNFNAASIGTSNFGVVDFQVGHNIQIPVHGYTVLNVGAQIAEIANNTNFNGYILNPNIPSFAGNAGYNGLSISGTLGTFGTGSINGIIINPTATLVANATGLSINMSGINVYAGTKSAVVIQDLTLEFINVGDNNTITVEYVSDVLAGAETASFSNPNIVVHIESGVSTATQVKAALDANSTILTNINTTITGVGSNPQTTQGPVNFAGGTNAGTKRAIDVTGDVNITGSLAFSGAISLGQISSFAAQTVTSGAGVVSIDTLITSPSVGNGLTISGTDMLAINTASLMTIGTGSTVTTSFLGWAALGLPAVLTVGAGSTIDRVSGAVFALSLGGGAGTVDQVTLCRAIGIPDGTTTVNRLYGYGMDMPFGSVGTDAWGIYIAPACNNWMAGSLRIGGTTLTDDKADTGFTLHNEGDTKLEGDLAHLTGNLGFFGTAPVAQQTGGAATATALYTGTEQAMLQAAYNALRAYGLLT